MKLKIPPAVVFIICLVSMFGIYSISKELSFQFAYRTALSRIFLITGFFSGLLGVLAFRLKNTTVDPANPQKATSLVTHGVYQYTRNPMYLGMALVLVGGAIRIGNPFCLLTIVLFVWYITTFQIKPEEEALSKIFGQDYEGYKKEVRRWI
ncbi:MAG: isoprenylcysteine carboxylmethyltransferase family protein [Bacteroidota bacterium]